MKQTTNALPPHAEEVPPREERMDAPPVLCGIAIVAMFIFVGVIGLAIYGGIHLFAR